ncbi:unnamed protein product [Prorocentrum cordatum]|uniref:subtilisin n=1 Tax=Prorocentrum cordatum TaxID=2364126 RepID=A0ABN9TKL0_9DINO|nr:unnamed protein product [Polarella glacialis]
MRRGPDPYVKKAWEHIVPEGATRRTYPWGIQDINADVVRGRGAGVNVYVLDTGIRTTHVEFGGRAFAGVDIASTGNFTICSPTDTACAADAHGHGTHVAGTVGASTYGVANGATLWAMKVLDDAGLGYTFWSIVAEQYVLTSGLRPAVVSMSLGGPGQSSPEQDSINDLVADGVTVVVAAGNQNDDACGYNPAWIPSAITVASYDSAGAKSSFSNYGSCIDVWAPGSSILSTYIGSDTALGLSSGTSMACPHVSGLAAIMYEANPTAGSMTASQRWALLTASQRTGYVTGIPTTPASVNLVALAPTPTPSPTPSPTPLPTPMPTPIPAPPAPPPPPPSPTPGPTPGGAAATGDPHLQNVHGEQFDLMLPGKHVLLNIPRGMSAGNALLRVQADARRLGGHCADMYFQELNITGSWAEAKRTGGYQYSVSQRVAEAQDWLAFGSSFRKVNVKVVQGSTRKGLKYLNVYVKNLGRVGLSVGGLLGEDDHKDVSISSAACSRKMTLLEVATGPRDHGPSESSVAAASFG